MFAFSTVKSARLEGLGTSPGGLAAVRFANLFPFCDREKFICYGNNGIWSFFCKRYSKYFYNLVSWK